MIDIKKLGYYISREVNTDRITKKRRVEYTEIELYATTGNTSVINGTEYPQQAGNVLISLPGDERYSIEEFECWCVHFDCADNELNDIIRKLPKVFASVETDRIRDIFADMINAEAEKRDGYKIYVNAKLLELVSELVQDINKIPKGRYAVYAPNVSCACRFIEEEYDCHITLADIAASANLSPSFFHTVFKTAIGRTPAEYLCDIRISKAKNQLKNTDLPISEIAQRCGFDNQSYFCYVFKSCCGITPKKYRDGNRLVL